ncbi:hypothetical protein DFS34DRAFT_653237 [Phlyctochytrium arcticum]|nr:hypothetical protein DFS34DRAFT_653237 [Phlyctochytrium arcticum]
MNIETAKRYLANATLSDSSKRNYASGINRLGELKFFTDNLLFDPVTAIARINAAYPNQSSASNLTKALSAVFKGMSDIEKIAILNGYIAKHPMLIQNSLTALKDADKLKLFKDSLVKPYEELHHQKCKAIIPRVVKEADITMSDKQTVHADVLNEKLKKAIKKSLDECKYTDASYLIIAALYGEATDETLRTDLLHARWRNCTDNDNVTYDL